MNLFDIFKGRTNKKGTVLKLRSIGHGYYDEASEFCELLINGLQKDSYSIMPESDIDADHDYNIFFEDLDSEDLEKVGVGYLLKKQNSGLIRLEWDFYGVKDIYINLAHYEPSESFGAAA
jgi:hypothetical protein